MNLYWFVIGFLVGIIAMHELWRWLNRKMVGLNETLIAEQREYIETLEAQVSALRGEG